MRIMNLDNVKPGMKLGRTIYSSGGNVLLASGVVLNEQFIVRLRELALPAIYVLDESIGAIELNDVISEQTRTEAIALTQDIMKNIRNGKEADFRKISRVINAMTDEIIHNRNEVISLVDIGSMKDIAFRHAVNVTVLSLMVGTALGYDQLSLKNLAVGAFLHDIGLSALSKTEADNLNRSKSMDLEHPTVGFEIIRKLEGVSLFSAHVALQHHEQIDGQGYPRGLAGNDIHEFARIVAIANTYDILTTDTPKRARYTAKQALEYLAKHSGSIFDLELVKLFASVVALFPVGEPVLLNTLEQGIVVKVQKGLPARPVIRILIDSEGKHLVEPYEVDLSKAPHLAIARTLEIDEIAFYQDK